MPKTIKRLLQQCLEQIDHLDAELLISHVIGKSREFLISHPEYKIGVFKIWKIKKLTKKCARGIPLAYLIGHKNFYGMDFIVNKHVLIPRPETELMIDLALHKLKTENLKLKTILIDAGTGSGCIPISILKTIRTSTMIRTFATDISHSAIRVAKKNAKKHDVDIKFLHGNLLEPMFKELKIKNEELRIMITANLPYLTEKQFQNEFSIQHEPKVAIISSKDGLALYEELLKQIESLLSSFYFSLSAFFEIDPEQSVQITKLINIHLPKHSVEIKKDLAGRNRIVVIKNFITHCQ